MEQCDFVLCKEIESAPAFRMWAVAPYYCDIELDDIVMLEDGSLGKVVSIIHNNDGITRKLITGSIGQKYDFVFPNVIKRAEFVDVGGALEVEFVYY